MQEKTAKSLLIFSILTTVLCLTDYLSIIVSFVVLVIAWIWRTRSVKKYRKHEAYIASSLKMDHDITMITLVIGTICFVYHLGKFLIVILGSIKY